MNDERGVVGGRGWLVAALAAAGLALACSHTQTTGSTESTGEGAATAQGDHATPPKDRPARSATASKPYAKPPADRGSAEPAEPALPLATSPSGLLKPGAEKKIQQKLEDQGVLEGDPTGEIDGATQTALRRFQREQGLPATGAPDDATVRKLGLDPADVFKTADQAAAAP